jgi:phosphatidylinositol glycan class M
VHLTGRPLPRRALLSLPNLHLPAFGKLLYSALDLLMGGMLMALLQHDGVPLPVATASAALFLLSPITANVSTRGSADVAVACLVAATLLAIQRRRAGLAGAILGIATHIRLYPVMYTVPLVLHVLVTDRAEGKEKSGEGSDGGEVPPPRPARHRGTSGTRKRMTARRGTAVSPPAEMRAAPRASPYAFVATERLRSAVAFVAAECATFAVFTGASWLVYGEQYLDSSLLYHLSRSDGRHNFSSYFYALYLGETADAGRARSPLALLAFVPQAVSLILLGVVWCRHPGRAVVLQTLAFVALNKVVTAQYFCWWMALMPLAAPYVTASASAALCAVTWVVTELAWNANAYFLEIEGQDNFSGVWTAGLAFLAASVLVLLLLLR